jgi:hypothetical protein
LLDEFPDAAKDVRSGETWVAPLAKEGTVFVPDGLIHDWVGAVFISNVSLEDVLSVVRDYAKYPRFYRPVVLESACARRDASRDLFSMIWSKKIFFTAVTLESEFESHYSQISETQWISASYSTRILEIKDLRKPTQRRLEPGEGGGYIWRLNSFARYQEKDSGVYVEVEAIALSRDIPAAVRWLVSPMVARSSRDALAVALQQTRKAVVARTTTSRGFSEAHHPEMGATHS